MNVKYGDIVYIKLYNKSRKRIISGKFSFSTLIFIIFSPTSVFIIMCLCCPILRFESISIVLFKFVCTNNIRVYVPIYCRKKDASLHLFKLTGDGMGSNKVECIFLKPSIE